jgi:hypothetical protein
MKRRNEYLFSICCLVLTARHSAEAQAVRVASRRVAPRLTVLDTLTLTASPGLVKFNLVSKGKALGSSAVTINTSWTGLSLFSSLAIYAFFSSATAALSGGTPVSNIPSSCVLGEDPNGIPTAFVAFTQTSSFGVGSSLQLLNQTSLLSLGGSRVDNLTLEIDLSSVPQLPAATYSGVLLLQAQAF